MQGKKLLRFWHGFNTGQNRRARAVPDWSNLSVAKLAPMQPKAVCPVVFPKNWSDFNALGGSFEDCQIMVLWVDQRRWRVFVCVIWLGRDKCKHLQEENAEIARQLSEEKLQANLRKTKLPTFKCSNAVVPCMVLILVHSHCTALQFPQHTVLAYILDKFCTCPCKNLFIHSARRPPSHQPTSHID